MFHPYSAAALLLALTGAVHVVMGGAEVYHPLLAAAPGPELQLYVALLWHFVTAFFVLGAAGMIWAARAPGLRRPTAIGIGLLAMAMGVLFVTLGLAYLGEIWTAPQWTVTLLIGGLVLWPARHRA